MRKIPFKMIVNSNMEKYRHKTWATKEPETIAWIKSFKNGDSFIDIGANIGIYSLYCAAIHPKSKVYAYEPHDNNFFRLLDNIKLNGFHERIVANRFLIGEKTCRKEFVNALDEVGSSGGQMVDSDKINHIPCFSIDDLNFHGFDFPNPNHIKIDIDGQELKVLQGMEQTLKMPSLESILVEINENRDEILLIMAKNRFSTDNKFNYMRNHSRFRRIKEGISCENVIFTRY